MTGAGSGVCAGDCADDDATRRAGIAESCGNAVDDNCNGVTDESSDDDSSSSGY